MAKIREDLVGVVSVAGLNLRPGEEVPTGVSVGEHVLAPETSAAESTAAAAVEPPAGNATTEAWAEYARSLGVEVLEGDGREDIKDRVEQLQQESGAEEA